MPAMFTLHVVDYITFMSLCFTASI